MKYLTLAEVKAILLEENEKRELNPLQKAALSHAEEFVKLTAEDSRKLVEELMGLDFMDERHAVKIADILPIHPDQVRTIYSKEKIVLPPEDIKKVLDTVAKYI
ncbi:MAG: RNA polymerase [Euryarchaeota archaeon]|nr:RNA polymerase [Euryarchaeota archaeon]